MHCQATGAVAVTVRGREVGHTETQELCPGEESGYKLLTKNGDEEANSFVEIEWAEPERSRPDCVPSQENNYLCP